MNPLAVIGLGNPFMSDEGVGIAVTRCLSAEAECYPHVDIIELGTAGMRLLHVLEGRRKVIFVDCARMDEAPGTLRRFTPGQVRSRKALAGFSLHEGDLVTALELAKRTGVYPEQVVIIGIQPQSIAPGECLSPTLHARLNEYVGVLDKEIADCEGEEQ